MRLLHYLSCFLYFCVLLSGIAAADQDTKRWYRYTDDNHLTILSDTLNSDAMQHGYEILDTHLEVIQTVPPPPDAHQRQLIEQKKQQLSDLRYLQKMYGTPADARQQMANRLNALQASLDIQKTSAERAHEDRETDAERAANFERSGHTPPHDLLQRIQDDNRRILNIQHQSQDIENQMKTVKSQFDGIISKLEAAEKAHITNDARSSPIPASSE
ncbi:MAG: hypothetical protein HKM02_01970 [Pseudomonadales bacterium]|nr:hypothetical protein [Pseudomonadales bacterium]